MVELRNFNLRRGKSKASSTRFVNYVKEIDYDATQLKISKEKIDKCGASSTRYRNVIELEADTEQGPCRVKPEETYFKVVSDAA